MEYYTNILNTIGNTPLLRLEKITDFPIYAKAEYLNPGGSVKDRVARHLIEQAEKSGELKPGMVIAEATSGNTGIGVTFVGVHKGYRVIIVMPDNMSVERRKIIRAFGGELICTPAEESLNGCLAKLEELKRDIPDLYIPGQFTNPGNPEIHYKTTAAEIWKQMEGQVDAFVAGVGSGGTLAGVGKFLKEKDPDIMVVAVEPANVSALLGHEPGLHKIEGIGDGFIPDVLDVSMIDDVITVTDDDAIETARNLTLKEGALVGTSSGANIWSAIELSHRIGKDKNIVTILPDRAERYFSTALI
ncbi:Cysteine synthase [Pontiella sulfatireligans]|uniref:Cysteine synthase n=2 Tax=Pontiella sulfatireligans TaxID=2750658 RepID=A0A6C2UUM6_9BACT|nr:Cysteine synthase [Pontiella sulfatireligans]